MSTARRILIVDDEEINREVLRDFVHSLGYVPLFAVNGVAALACIRQQKPDLVLLDIRMPVMDGFEVLGQLKRNSELRKIPVIVISAFDDTKRIRQCIAAGAEDYLTKPFDSEFLHARIQGALTHLEVLEEEENQRNHLDRYLVGLNENHHSFAPPVTSGAPSEVTAESPDTTFEASVSLQANLFSATPSQGQQPPFTWYLRNSSLTQDSVTSCDKESLQRGATSAAPFSASSTSLHTRIVVLTASCLLMLTFSLLAVFYSRGNNNAESLASLPPVVLSDTKVMRRDTRPIQPRPTSQITSINDSTDESGTLWMLSVGVSNYRDRSSSLKFPADDARALTEAFQSDGTGRFFQAVESRVLVDEQATRKNILDELRALKQSPTQYDLVIVAFAGHGEKDTDNAFFFAPYDFDWNEQPAVTGVAWEDIRRFLYGMPCHVLLMMDCCHSGEITKWIRGHDSRDLDRELRRVTQSFRDSEKSLIVMAASLSDQYANEHPKWGHGAMTLAILESLAGKHIYLETKTTQLPNDNVSSRILTLHDVDRYVTDRVRELTGGRQAVVTNDSGNIDLSSIPIALLTDSTQ